MRRGWFIVGGAIGAIVINIIIFANSGVVNSWFNFTNADRTIMLATIIVEGGAGLVLPLILRWSEKKEHVIKEQTNKMEDHKCSIIQEFEAYRENYKSCLDLSDISGFRYRKELLQHLFTGHRSIIDAISQFSIDNQLYYKANEDLRDYVNAAVKREAEALGFKPEQKEGGSYYSDGLSPQLIQLARTKVNEFFVEQDPSGLFAVVRHAIGSRYRCAISQDRSLVQKLANTLNELARDPEIPRLFEKTTELNANIIASYKEWLRLIEELINAINLKAKNLQGVCNGCAHLQKSKDLSQIDAEFKELENIEWVRECLKN